MSRAEWIRLITAAARLPARLGGDGLARGDEGLAQLLRIEVVELVGDHGS